MGLKKWSFTRFDLSFFGSVIPWFCNSISNYDFLISLEERQNLAHFCVHISIDKIYLEVDDDVFEMSLVLRKPVFRVSDQVRHKPGCTAIKDG